MSRRDPLLDLLGAAAPQARKRRRGLAYWCGAALGVLMLAASGAILVAAITGAVWLIVSALGAIG